MTKRTRSWAAEPARIIGPTATTRSGLDRASCAWRDAVGSGYAIGVTQNVAATVSELDSAKYCR